MYSVEKLFIKQAAKQTSKNYQTKLEDKAFKLLLLTAYVYNLVDS
jgi:hypothetical protein